MADTTTKKLEQAQAEIVKLRADLQLERNQRRQVEANAREGERTLRAKIEKFERARTEVEVEVRESKTLAASAQSGDVFRQRVAQLEFGVGCVEVGPVPEGVHVIVRVPPGTTSGRVMAPLRELACLVADDQVPLDPKRGAWELVRTASAEAREADFAAWIEELREQLDVDAADLPRAVDAALAERTALREGADELAEALDELRTHLGIEAAELPAFLRALREAHAEGAPGAEGPGEGVPAEALSAPQEGAASADGSDPSAAGVEAGGAARAPVEGSRRRRSAAAG